MGTSMMQDSYEMRDFHRGLLQRNRVYLLHNIRPTEILWSSLIAREVLSQEMVDEIKACKTTNEQVGRLLDFLPTRGPNTFDLFCTVLLESDYPHVAEYLKTSEVTDQFRRDIQPFCPDVSDHLLDRYVNVFKRNTPAVMRFAERKYEMILNETTNDLRLKENEIRDLENRNRVLDTEVSNLRTFLKSCAESSDNIANEVQREFLSKTFLREEADHLEKLKTPLQGTKGYEKIITLLTDLQIILRFLERHAGVRMSVEGGSRHGGQQHGVTSMAARADGRGATDDDRPDSPSGNVARDHLQALANCITSLADAVGSKPTVSGLVVRVEAEKMMRTVREVAKDLSRVREAFRAALKQKQKLDSEVLSLLRTYQEIRRIERELKEKAAHITDFTKQIQLMKKKVSSNPRQQRRLIDQITNDVDRYRKQMTELEESLRQHTSSADRRVSAMLNLLPDCDELSIADENSQPIAMRSDTEITASSATNNGNTNSRAASPVGEGISLSVKPASYTTAASPRREPIRLSTVADVGTSGRVTARSDVEGLVGGRKLLERRRSKQQAEIVTSTGNMNTKRTSINLQSTMTPGRSAETVEVDSRTGGGEAADDIAIRPEVQNSTTRDGRNVALPKRSDKVTEVYRGTRDNVMRGIERKNVSSCNRTGGGSSTEDEGDGEGGSGSSEDSGDDDESSSDGKRRRFKTPQRHVRAEPTKPACVQQPKQAARKKLPITTAAVNSGSSDGSRHFRGFASSDIAESPLVQPTVTSYSSSSKNSSPATDAIESKRSIAAHTTTFQPQALGVANLAALLTSPTGGVMPVVGTMGTGAAGNSSDFFGGKAKVTSIRQPMATSRVELALKLP